MTTCHLEYVFEIKNPLTDKRQDSHRRRTKLPRKKGFVGSGDTHNHIEYYEKELMCIEKFENIRRTAARVRLLVKWKIFETKKRFHLVSASRQRFSCAVWTKNSYFGEIRDIPAACSRTVSLALATAKDPSQGSLLHTMLSKTTHGTCRS